MAPTYEQAQQYGIEIGLSEDDIDRCFYYHETRGWVVSVGRNVIPMKNWKGAFQTWKRNKKLYDKPTEETYEQRLQRILGVKPVADRSN